MTPPRRAPQIGPVTLENLFDRAFDIVELIEHSGECLRLRVSDPNLYPAYPEFDLCFQGVQVLEGFEGEDQLDDVKIRRAELPPQFEPQQFSAFEFVSREIRPTEGRPYQFQILEDGSSRILFGEAVESREAFVVAQAVLITTPREKTAE